MTVAVIGGGVIGLNAAWSLRRRGEDVTVIERGAIGHSASAVNAGWITPSLSTPLASPGILRLGLEHAFDPNGAVSIRPRLDTDWIRWLWKFARAARPATYEKGVRALLHLNAHTLDLFDELHDDGVDFEMHSAGLLALAKSTDGLQWFTQLFDQLIPMGFTGTIEYLSGNEARQRDNAIGGGVHAAAHTSIDRHVHPESLLHGLHEKITEMGVTVHEHTAVEALIPTSRKWTIHTPDTAIRADQVIVALGAATNTLLIPLGARLPIVGAKGYSVDLHRSGTLPRHSLYLMEPKLGVSPYHDSLRIAGAFELPSADETTIPTRRIRTLIEQTRPYLSERAPHTAADLHPTHAGLRPATPDSLPFIGPVPDHTGLYVAAGHGMLGVTLAPATAEGLAEMLTTHRIPEPMLPFQLAGRI
ncbi:D-amino-acid dehydrogenase [Rhodococcus jostii]|uniref:D-amino-acid dehydrogenase n=1 Tax=Rhodococcus jostii TaxID=132919 RepID=A0A1H5H3L2_RHOJO|nr:FAD-dependent oxidoreductase [Rhodococcus jostii]SEE22582.1 D-amino-acid dehydrogenase [Rhodococcus jostii]